MSENEANVKKIMSNGSKSFSLASLFLSSEQQLAAGRLYHWCRYSDDLVDEGQVSHENFSELLNETEKLWQVDYQPVNESMQNMQLVVHGHSIPKKYALDLLLGMKMDLEGRVYNTMEELKTYCYHVAGTVGLMMTHIIGVFRAGALENAVHLGIAMQLSNICRDVKADSYIGRVYIPRVILAEQGLEESNILNVEHRDKLFTAMNVLIKESDLYYESGRKGIIDLPLRCAFVMTIASYVYQEINREIERRGKNAINTRTVVPLWRKLCLIGYSFYQVLKSVPVRLTRKASTVEPLPLWRQM